MVDRHNSPAGQVHWCKAVSVNGGVICCVNCVRCAVNSGVSGCVQGNMNAGVSDGVCGGVSDGVSGGVCGGVSDGVCVVWVVVCVRWCECW